MQFSNPAVAEKFEIAVDSNPEVIKGKFRGLLSDIDLPTAEGLIARKSNLLVAKKAAKSPEATKPSATAEKPKP